MKKVIISLLVIGLFFTIFVNLEAEQISLERVIETPEMSKDALFTLINLWFVDLARSAGIGTGIQFSEKESGIISGIYVNENIRAVAGDHHIVTATVTIEVREGRYKISFTNPTWRFAKSSRTGVENPVIRGRALNNALADKVVAEWEKEISSLDFYIFNGSNSW